MPFWSPAWIAVMPSGSLSPKYPKSAGAVGERQLERRGRRHEASLIANVRPPSQEAPGDFHVSQPLPLRCQKEDDEATSPPRLSLEPVAIDPPVGRDDHPASFVSERGHPYDIFGIGWKSIGQVDDLVAFGAEQDIQCVSEMR